MSVASPALRAAYIRAKSGILSDAEKKAERMAEKERVEKEEQEVYIGKRKMLEEGDACPICYEVRCPVVCSN